MDFITTTIGIGIIKPYNIFSITNTWIQFLHLFMFNLLNQFMFNLLMLNLWCISLFLLWVFLFTCRNLFLNHTNVLTVFLWNHFQFEIAWPHPCRIYFQKTMFIPRFAWVNEPMIWNTSFILKFLIIMDASIKMPIIGVFHIGLSFSTTF